MPRTRAPEFRQQMASLAGLISCTHVIREESRLSISCRSRKIRTEELCSSVLPSVVFGGGGGSRTRVRSTLWSASTSLVPHFDLNSYSPAD